MPTKKEIKEELQKYTNFERHHEVEHLTLTNPSLPMSLAKLMSTTRSKLQAAEKREGKMMKAAAEIEKMLLEKEKEEQRKKEQKRLEEQKQLEDEQVISTAFAVIDH